MYDHPQISFTSAAMRYVKDSNIDVRAFVRFVDGAIQMATEKFAARFNIERREMSYPFSKFMLLPPAEMPDGLANVPAMYNFITGELVLNAGYARRRYLDDDSANKLAAVLLHEFEHGVQTEVMEDMHGYESDNAWGDEPIEQGAEVQRVISLLNDGVTEQQIFDMYAKSDALTREQVESMIDIAKEMDPQSTALAWLKSALTKLGMT